MKEKFASVIIEINDHKCTIDITERKDFKICLFNQDNECDLINSYKAFGFMVKNNEFKAWHFYEKEEQRLLTNEDMKDLWNKVVGQLNY